MKFEYHLANLIKMRGNDRRVNKFIFGLSVFDLDSPALPAGKHHFAKENCRK